MNKRIIKQKSNGVELTIYTLDKEYQKKFFNKVNEFAPINWSKKFTELQISYMSLDYLQKFFRDIVRFEIEITPIIDVTSVSKRTGKYRWSIAIFDQYNEAIPGKYLFYSDTESRCTYNSYNDALDSAIKYTIDNLFVYIRNPYYNNSNKKQETYNNKNMKEQEFNNQTTTGNQVDDFVNEVKNAFKEVKSEFSTGVENVKDFVDEFNRSEFKREMSESAKEVKDKAVDAGKKGIKFAKAMFNAGKAFVDTMK